MTAIWEILLDRIEVDMIFFTLHLIIFTKSMDIVGRCKG